MSKHLLPILMVTTLIAACQSLPAPKTADNGFSEAAYAAQQTARSQLAQGQKVQQTLYWTADWEASEKAVADGYYRQNYGIQDNGLYLLQDFYVNGKKQTDLFYGTNPANADSSSARGWLAIYNQDGTRTMLANYRAEDDYLRHDFCQGKLCAIDETRPTFEQQTLLDAQGKTFALWQRVNNDKEQNLYLKMWYPNGQLALEQAIIASSDGEAVRRREQRYWLADGSAQATMPQTAVLQDLFAQAKTILQNTFGYSEGESYADGGLTMSDEPAQPIDEVEHAAASDAVRVISRLPEKQKY